jgi:hypothetical protein
MIMTDFNRNDDGTAKSSSSMGWVIAIIVMVALVVAAFAFGFIDINQTKMTKLPTVAVETTGGQAPAFDVKTATVDVGTKKSTIEVPTVAVGTKDTSITLPTVDVKPARNPDAKN